MRGAILRTGVFGRMILASPPPAMWAPVAADAARFAASLPATSDAASAPGGGDDALRRTGR